MKRHKFWMPRTIFRTLWMPWSYILLDTSGLTLVQEGVNGQEVPKVLTQSLKCVLRSVIEGESGQHDSWVCGGLPWKYQEG